MSRVDVKRDQPVAGTHLTEPELQEMWYQYCESLAKSGGPPSYHRAHKRLFPRSRRDLIAYFTEQSLGQTPISDQ